MAEQTNIGRGSGPSPSMSSITSSSSSEVHPDADMIEPGVTASDPAPVPDPRPYETKETAVIVDSAAEAAAPPYSVYNRREKWFLVAMVAVAGFYSPLPANIYFPAIPQMSTAFHKSTSALNQTVTAYLVMQGVCECPSRTDCILHRQTDRRTNADDLFSSYALGTHVRPPRPPARPHGLHGRADRLLCRPGPVSRHRLLAARPSALCPGRRLCQHHRPGRRRRRRHLDAQGARRLLWHVQHWTHGVFFLFFSHPLCSLPVRLADRQIAPCIGPAMGGIIAEKLGWRAIFWALVILAALCLVFILW